MTDASHIAEFLKVILRPRYLFGIWAAPLILLLVPVDYLDKFGLTGFMSNYRPWITIVFLLAFFIWIAVLGMDGWDKVVKKREATKRKETEVERKESLESTRLDQFSRLSQNEWFFLQMCLDKNDQTFLGYFQDQYIVSLISRKMVVAPPAGDMFNYPFKIADWAWDHIQDNRENVMPDDLENFRRYYARYDNMSELQRKNFFRPNSL